MDDKNIFGQRIFEFRQAAGMTQKQLGEAVGLSMQAINDIEKGRRETKITKAIRIARLFNTTVEYLAGKLMTQPAHDKPRSGALFFAFASCVSDTHLVYKIFLSFQDNLFSKKISSICSGERI